MIDRAFLQPVMVPAKNPSKPVNPFDVAGDISASSNAAGPSDMPLPSETNIAALADAPPEYQYPLPADTRETGTTQLVEHVPPVFTELSESRARAKSNDDSEWYETLRELQTNLVDLRTVKTRASKLSTLARVVPFLDSHKSRAVEAEREVRVLEELVLAGMRRLANIHADPLVQVKWDARAEELSKNIHSSNDAPSAGNNAFLIDSETIVYDDLESSQRTGRILLKRRDGTRLSSNESIWMGLGKGFLIIFCTPFILAGAILFVVGAILYGIGKMIIGLGHLLTFGKFHS